MAGEGEKALASSGGASRRVLMFPVPFQGHINPMMQLADLLHSRGFRITVFHAAFNAPDPARHPAGYRFVLVGAGVPAGDLIPTGSNADFAGAMLRINERLQAPFQESLREVLEEETAPACLVVDSNFRGMQVVAERLGVPTLVLRTGGAACLVAYMAFPALCDKGVLPPQDSDQSRLDMPLDDLQPLRLRDMVFSATTPHETMAICVQRIVESARHSSGLIVNTFNDIEDAELRKIIVGAGVPVYDIGPLHRISAGAQDSLLAEDRTCLDWLDKQETASVLYVSFGSLASMDQEELVECAWGLANSHMPFLWVIRPNLVQCSEEVGLPDGFEEATCGRGMVVSWAPQQEVLVHRSVGGFWTHNGWNSTLESICEGVPMICRPHFADQMINARYVQEVWKIGFVLEGKLERRKIENSVKKLLGQAEGEEMRRRASYLKDKASQCIKKGGTSETKIDLLVNRIISF